MDQSSRGVKRTLGCCKLKPCKSTCPWRISVKIKNYVAGSEDYGPLIADKNGGKVSRFNLAKSRTEAINSKMSGHSARRSGAMFYTKEGPSLTDIMFLGRWKSAAVFRYMEEAMAELPWSIALAELLGDFPSQNGPPCAVGTSPEPTVRWNSPDSKNFPLRAAKSVETSTSCATKSKEALNWHSLWRSSCDE